MKIKTCSEKQVIKQKNQCKIQNISLIRLINDRNFRHSIALVGKAPFSPLHILSHKLLLTSPHFLVYDQPNTI